MSVVFWKDLDPQQRNSETARLCISLLKNRLDGKISVEDFEKEFTRIFKELEVYKVQHLLGRSRFGSGMVGIIDLEG